MTGAGNIVLAAARRILPLVENIDFELKKLHLGKLANCDFVPNVTLAIIGCQHC
jgi:hypothetical protein